MANKLMDLSGNTYGYLTVICRAKDYVTKCGKHNTMWLCKCNACGNFKIAYGQSLKNGSIKSCGCMHFEALKKTNEYKIVGNLVYVELSNTKNTMICDLDDWNKLKNHCWCEGKDGYAECNMKGNTTLFHHCVIECRRGMVRDHINQNKLDNRKENLREVTYSINNSNRKTRNKYGVKGLYKTGNHYYLKNLSGGKHMKSFRTVEEAKNYVENIGKG